MNSYKLGLKTFSLCLACVAAGALILIFPKEIGGAVKDGVASCLEVVIPLLFAFTVLSVYL